MQSSVDKERHILGDVTEVLDLGLQTPVPFVFSQERVLVEMPKCLLAKSTLFQNLRRNVKLTLSRTDTCDGNFPYHHT